MTWKIPSVEPMTLLEEEAMRRPRRAPFVFRGLVKLRRSVLKRIFRVFGRRFIVARRMGALFLLDQLNLIDRRLLVGRGWEIKQIACLKGLIEKYRQSGRKAVFLDIGAHGGLYSILFATRLSFDQIIAFEPSPVNATQLRANLYMNGLLDRVEVIAKAAGEEAGVASFSEVLEHNRGLSRLVAATPPLRFANSLIQVEVARVDAEAPVENAFVAAKIDVEGAELSVVNGMTGLFAANDIVLQVECNDRKFEALRTALASHGFRLLGAIGEDRYFTNCAA